ncbi:MAG: competence protein ComE [Betaproteobacteria bacterium HGW-Betaproteobacteria-22]|nr:MAG: competence protein ComE [Betaproteobacteria bacterium HGW-Betaproteobacteria-22]
MAIKNIRIFLILLFTFSLNAWAVIDINTARQAELETLAGIGAVKAKAIIDYRQKHGPFKSVNELEHVSGIGKSTLNAIRDKITVNRKKMQPKHHTDHIRSETSIAKKPDRPAKEPGK